MVCTTHAPSVKSRAAWRPSGQWGAVKGRHASRPTSSSTTTLPPAAATPAAAPVCSSTARVSPMPERSPSVSPCVPRRLSSASRAPRVAGCVDAGNGSALLKFALTATSRPSQARNANASKHAATALARSVCFTTTTRLRAGGSSATSAVGRAAVSPIATPPPSTSRRDSMPLLYPRRRGRPRREAAHVALCAPALVFDREAACLHRPLGLAVRVTAAAEPRPERRVAVLQPRLPRRGRAHVLEHPELAARPEHAPDLGEPAARVGDAAEDEPAHDSVEGAVAKGQGFHAALDQGDPGRPPPRARERLAAGLEPDGADGIEREVPARPAADVERQPARSRDEPAPPAAKAEALHDGAHRVVEPRNLFAPAHRVDSSTLVL